MHVAYIHQHFSTPQGATGTRSYEMSRHLIDAGHRVTLICGAYDAGDMGDKLTGRVNRFDLDGIHLNCIAEPYGNEMGFLRRLKSFGSFARAATRLVRQLDADLVFASSTPLTVGIPGMKGADALGVPFVFEVRDLWPTIAREIEAGSLVQIPLEGQPLVRPLGIIHRRDRKLSETAQQFIELLRSQAAPSIEVAMPVAAAVVETNGRAEQQPRKRTKVAS